MSNNLICDNCRDLFVTALLLCTIDWGASGVRVSMPDYPKGRILALLIEPTSYIRVCLVSPAPP